MSGGNTGYAMNTRNENIMSFRVSSEKKKQRKDHKK